MIQETRAARRAKPTDDGEKRAWNVGRPMKNSGSTSGLQPRKMKPDSRVETVRRLITYLPSGEILIQPPGVSVDVAENTHWRDTKTYQGVTYLVEEDELTLPSDPKGDTKVNPDGALLGGRQYKIPTFSLKCRANPNKRFMLSIDAARAAGYRDSLYFFRRNPLIQKLLCTQQEKDMFIAAGFLSGNLKSRAVTMCSARNAYKVIGARFLKGGKHVIDDYYEDAALASGEPRGEAAIADGLDPQDRLASGATAVPETSEAPPPNSAAAFKPPVKLLPHQSNFRTELNRINPLAIASVTSKTNFGGDGRSPAIAMAGDIKDKKRKQAPNLTSKNWMLQYCRAISEMNRHLRWIREDRMRPFPQYPSIACSQKLKTKNVTGNGSENLGDSLKEDVEMEWRYVEEEFRINREGRVLGSDSDWNEEEKEEENENSDKERNQIFTKTSSSAVLMSRIAENLPEDSLMTIYGIEGTEKGNSFSIGKGDQKRGKNVGKGAGDGSTTGEAGQSGSKNQSVKGRPPFKRFKTRRKKSRNDWWTTSRKVRKKVPARPVVGLLDVCTGQVHVRKDTQPTRALYEKLGRSTGLEDEKKRKIDEAFGEPVVDGFKQIDSYKRSRDDSNWATRHGIDFYGVEAVFIDDFEALGEGGIKRNEFGGDEFDLIPGMWNFRS
ncbi:chromatin remodelling complex Rsc7/Swp82 subunit-domain-containing protein [Phakopsora pachyrhizi]|nr:chromatin remodelling complex Rsc7/Swp82 subunit-domain-containing protein [Phakopsora pachyrhizi]